ncbi:DUF2510 domain-containing protein [Microbacterium sp. NPDC087589]|uniref:DUF2510 domain-containing protein n=1 Tax=Microbacterium sp. NPDC087589 TaxID=3364191 RepID=UPI003821C67E
MIPVSGPPAGWYAISLNPSLLRWWNGAGWTDDVVVRAPSGVDSPQTAAAFLRRGRLFAGTSWILAGLWVALTVLMSVTGGYGVIWLLAPLPFIVVSVVFQSRLSRYRRLLAADAPPPYGLHPIR